MEKEDKRRCRKCGGGDLGACVGGVRGIRGVGGRGPWQEVVKGILREEIGLAEKVGEIERRGEEKGEGEVACVRAYARARVYVWEEGRSRLRC